MRLSKAFCEYAQDTWGALEECTPVVVDMPLWHTRDVCPSKLQPPYVVSGNLGFSLQSLINKYAPTWLFLCEQVSNLGINRHSFFLMFFCYCYHSSALLQIGYFCALLSLQLLNRCCTLSLMFLCYCSLRLILSNIKSYPITLAQTFGGRYFRRGLPFRFTEYFIKKIH